MICKAANPLLTPLVVGVVSDKNMIIYQVDISISISIVVYLLLD